MKATAKIKLDLRQPNYGSRVEAIQGDGDTRRVVAVLLDGGKPWTVPAGVTAAVAYQKPDHTKGLYDKLADGSPAVKVNGAVVTVELARQMLTVPGTVQAGIVFNDEVLDQLTTFPFTVEVAYNIFAGAEMSEDYIRLEWLEEKLDEYLTKAKESGEFNGPPGKAFAYEDFTAEQLENLKGDPGYTPVKGIDYYTPTEIAQIKSEVTPVKGEDYFDGEPGADAALILDEVSYQAGESGETPPTGTWQETIPAVPKGFYLWTRRVKQWNTGNPVTDYSVAYQGLDGSGTVSAVCGKSPDAAGNVAIAASDVGALATAGGDLTGEVRMNGQPISGLSSPTEDTQAANKGYVDAAIDGTKTASVSATLTAAGWVGDSAPYTQAIQVAGLTDGKRARAYPVYGDDTDTNLARKEACAMVSFASRSGSSMTFTCLEEKPSVDIPVTVEVYV